MGNIMRKTTEVSKDELINKLLNHDRFKSEGKHLYELTISELEYMYFKLQSDVHPHGGTDSIVWKNFSKKKNNR